MEREATTQRQIEFGDRAGKGKVLLVDEDSCDLKFFHMVLEQQGFGVVTCASYEAGLRCLEREPFDFVLVSQGSRAFEGRKVLDRAMQLNRRQAVLVVTRSIDIGCYLEAMQLGAVDYVEKPIPPAGLLRYVEAHAQAKPFRMRGSAA